MTPPPQVLYNLFHVSLTFSLVSQQMSHYGDSPSRRSCWVNTREHWQHLNKPYFNSGLLLKLFTHFCVNTLISSFDQFDIKVDDGWREADGTNSCNELTTHDTKIWDVVTLQLKIQFIIYVLSYYWVYSQSVRNMHVVCNNLDNVGCSSMQKYWKVSKNIPNMHPTSPPHLLHPTMQSASRSGDLSPDSRLLLSLSSDCYDAT